MDKPKYTWDLPPLQQRYYTNGEDFMEVYQTIYKDCNGYMWYVQKHSDIDPITKIEKINFFTGTCKELNITKQYKKKYLLLRAIHSTSTATKPYLLEKPLEVNEFVGKAVYVEEGFSICSSQDGMIKEPFLHIVNLTIHDQYFKNRIELAEFQAKLGKFIEEAINEKLKLIDYEN